LEPFVVDILGIIRFTIGDSTSGTLNALFITGSFSSG